MSSLCIKTNNEDILSYLQNEISKFNMLNVYLIKLFGHSGSSNKTTKQAWLPMLAAPIPNAAKIFENNFAINFFLLFFFYV